MYTIAFYNLENLFDPKADSHTLDADFAPEGSKKWTPLRYSKKLENLARAIVKIGAYPDGEPPVLVGVAEIEKDVVLRDLLGTPPLKQHNYDFVHYNSPDERGIDTALIYNRDQFKVIRAMPVPLMLYTENGSRDTTRDILFVEGSLNGERVQVFVNHWPSRRTGNGETDHKRMVAAHTITTFMGELETTCTDPRYIVMGDFNDGPTSLSIQALMAGGKLYNPMEVLDSRKQGSVKHRSNWNLFDQIMISPTFLGKEKGRHSLVEAAIFNAPFLAEPVGRYKGSPFRTFVGNRYMGGYSDHFPVYIQLELIV